MVKERNKWAVRIELTLQPHVALGETSGSLSGRSSLPFNRGTTSALDGRWERDPGETLRARICKEIDSRWCVRPAL